MIGFFQHQKSGCYWYRTKHPMDLLFNHGIDVRPILINTDIERDVYDKITAVQMYGIYPFSTYSVINKLKADGKKIVYDFDDAMEFVETTSPFYAAVQRDKASAREMLKLIDHVIVATPALKSYAEAMTNAPVTIVPNCYVPEEWTFPRPKRDGIRIGFSGASPHIVSLIKVLPAIKNLQKKYDIRFLIQGFSKQKYKDFINEYKACSNEDGIKAIEEFDEAMQGIKFEWVPFCDFNDFPSTLINMSLDIGLCPLKDTNFNRCRSASKAMEYTLSGALALATDIETFNQDKSSILIKDDKDWEEQIEFYINYPDIREKVRLEHLHWLRNNRIMDSQLETLKSIYEV